MLGPHRDHACCGVYARAWRCAEDAGFSSTQPEPYICGAWIACGVCGRLDARLLPLKRLLSFLGPAHGGSVPCAAMEVRSSRRNWLQVNLMAGVHVRRPAGCRPKKHCTMHLAHQTLPM